MPPNRSSRTSRKGGIPSDFVSSWQNSASQGPSKPRARRPLTACEACRATKVKCSAQQPCDRCVAQGSVCKYSPRTTRREPTPDSLISQPSSAGSAEWSPMVQTFTGTVLPMDLNLRTVTHVSPGRTQYEPVPGQERTGPLDWMNGTTHVDYGMGGLEWGAMNATLDVSFATHIPAVGI